MRGAGDILLIVLLVLSLAILGTNRLAGCVRLSALQGLVLAVLPFTLRDPEFGMPLALMVITSVGICVIKVGLIPFLLGRAIREANVRHEVEPFVSLHVSLVIGALLTGAAFWLSGALPLPRPARSALIVPIAFAMLFQGALILASRRKAISQVIGYLLLENGIFAFGQCLAHEMPFVVELGILLDLLVGIFVMGIAINHISREFDDIDTKLLTTLRDD